MARSGCTLQEAAMLVGKAITSEEANTILRRKSFSRVLWEERHRYFTTLGQDPNWQRDTFVGRMLQLAQKLEDEGSYDKAGEVYFKIAKSMNWVGPEQEINVFGDLSQKDIDNIREKVREGLSAKRPN